MDLYFCIIFLLRTTEKLKQCIVLNVADHSLQVILCQIVLMTLIYCSISEYESTCGSSAAKRMYNQPDLL